MSDEWDRIKAELEESLETGASMSFSDMPWQGKVFVTGEVNGTRFSANTDAEIFIGPAAFDAWCQELRMTVLLDLMRRLDI